MGCSCTRRPARETDTRVISLSASGTGQTRTIGPAHNWVEVLVDFGGHTAGGVQVYRLESDPDTCVTIRALAAEIDANSSDNGSTVLHVPPGARLIFATDANGGGGSTGPVVAMLSSWSEQ
jgi:hypothetical protein